jgi:hypothetical protein
MTTLLTRRCLVFTGAAAATLGTIPLAGASSVRISDMLQSRSAPACIQLAYGRTSELPCRASSCIFSTCCGLKL